MPLKNWCLIHARWSKSIPYISVAFFPSLKHNFTAYCSPKMSSRTDCIFEIHQLWQSGFNRVYSNCCCSCSFEAEIMKIGQSSHEIYNNNIENFQESTTTWNAHTKKVWKLIVCTSYKATHNVWGWDPRGWSICDLVIKVVRWPLTLHFKAYCAELAVREAQSDQLAGHTQEPTWLSCLYSSNSSYGKHVTHFILKDSNWESIMLRKTRLWMTWVRH